jgi:hypothetical protein
VSGERKKSFCELTECPTFDVKNYLRQLQQTLPRVPPINDAALKSLHQVSDYDGMLRLIRKTMNVEVKLRAAWVNSGGPKKMKNAPAWIETPDDMPFYGTDAFRKLTLNVFFRKSHLKRWEYDQTAIAIAHELSHVVLNSIKHPLRGCEKAVDLTAMMLGFRRLYVSGIYKQRHSEDRVEHYKLGYLSTDEVNLADSILEQPPLRSTTQTKPSSRQRVALGILLCLLLGVGVVGSVEFSRQQMDIQRPTEDSGRQLITRINNACRIDYRRKAGASEQQIAFYCDCLSGFADRIKTDADVIEAVKNRGEPGASLKRRTSDAASTCSSAAFNRFNR